VTDSPLDFQNKAQHSITGLREIAENDSGGQKGCSKARSAEMLERTFLGVPNTESLPQLPCYFVQHLQSSLGLGEALSALIETLCKNCSEVHHAKRYNHMTSSSYRIFSNKGQSDFISSVFFTEKNFKYMYSLSSAFWNFIYITFKSITGE